MIRLPPIIMMAPPTNEARASAVLQTVSKVANAAANFEINENRPAKSLEDLIEAGYLLSAPENPTGGKPPEFGTGELSGTIRMEIFGEDRRKIFNAMIRQCGGNPKDFVNEDCVAWTHI